MNHYGQCILALWLTTVSSQIPSAVFVGFRHANRNPAQFLINDPNEGMWGFEGEAQLNDVGKKQAYGFGVYLRQRYPNLVSDQWKSNEVEAITSSADRCQQTTQLVLAGLYPPKNWSNWSPRVYWQPVPIKIDDKMLRTYHTKCPKSHAVWKPVNEAKVEPVLSLMEANQDLVDFVAESTNMRPILSDMADVADNLEQFHQRHLRMPDWVYNNPFNSSIFDRIMRFSEGPQIGCTLYGPCRKMMAGYWINTVFELISRISQSVAVQKKMFLYGTHNEIASSFLQLLGVNQAGLPYNGAFILEFAKDEALIRLLYTVPTDDSFVRSTNVVRLCVEGDWCPLDAILLQIDAVRIENWRLYCGLQDCDV